jgi:hypothetical protein
MKKWVEIVAQAAPLLKVADRLVMIGELPKVRHVWSQKLFWSLMLTLHPMLLSWNFRKLSKFSTLQLILSRQRESLY